MPIEGIDIDRCNFCQSCVKECPLGNFCILKGKRQISFDSSQDCILCGHCIAACPEKAIIYTEMNGKTVDFDETIPHISNTALNRLMISKRSVRQYKNKKVPKEVIEQIINSMSFAPVAMNKHTLNCLVISDNKKIEELIESIIDSIEDVEEKEIYDKKREKGKDPFFHNAPHLLILHSDNDWDNTNGTIAISYGMLSAETLGIGSCWIGGVQMYLNENKDIKERVLGIKDKISGFMIFGYPQVKYYCAPPRPPIKTTFIS
jgi:nitroreductase/NAD-dependent dihydropyrimidine dehydrogenase PreA subunit